MKFDRWLFTTSALLPAAIVCSACTTSAAVEGASADSADSGADATFEAATTATDPGPAAITVEDSIGRYIYTANFIGNSVSSLYLDPNAGTTHPGQNTPFPGTAKATAVATVKHGDHTTEVIAQY